MSKAGGALRKCIIADFPLFLIFEVVENPVVSIGIFVIREGERIPLHDHPNMHGIIKCLQEQEISNPLSSHEI